MSPSRRPSGPGTSPGRVRIWLALSIVYAIWGSTYLGIRVVSAHLPPFGAAAIRFGLAGTLLLAIVAGRSRRVGALRVSGRQLGAAALVGVLLVAGGNGSVVLAESPRFHLPSGVAALLIALVPLLLVLMRIAAGDRPRRLTVAGVAVGFAGLIALFAPSISNSGGGIPLAGGIIVLFAALSWSSGSFASRYLPMPANPFAASGYEMLAGSAVMGTASLLHGEYHKVDLASTPWVAWLALGYLVLIGSLVAFTAYVWLLRHAPISLVATYAYVNPVIALGLGALFVAEPLTSTVLGPAAIVLLGVVLVVSTERPAPQPKPVPEPATPGGLLVAE